MKLQLFKKGKKDLAKLIKKTDKENRREASKSQNSRRRISTNTKEFERITNICKYLAA
jgi:hypothetical protein